MDLAETMKNVLAKGLQQASVSDLPGSGMGFPGAGYVTEKLYMLLQLYLQNKGWNPSVELLQCFTELKESSMLPSATYLQMMTSRVTLDSQGRLILRENGKIILPFEHFANAVMLKHMNGPHGLHLGVEATVRAVMESYTIGRENFGMEKEFIIEVVQNCPNPACRYYKNQMELTQKTLQHLAPGYLGERSSNSGDIRGRLGAVDLSGPQPLESKSQSHMERPKSVAPTQQEITAALLQQQSRVIAQQNLDKINANLEKQRQQLHLQQQLDLAAKREREQQKQQQEQQAQQQAAAQQQREQAAAAAAAAQREQQAAAQQQQSIGQAQAQAQKQQHFELPLMDHKITDFLRANIENLEGLGASNKDLLALHNGAWSSSSSNDDKRLNEGGQEKIVRAFSEVMKNMARMKTYVRPSMCKPYGKQSEALQKTLMDTIQLIQSLRSFLPPPHIQVSSWKNEDKHRYEEN
ncbi:vacuolar protein-sorting-associated protein 36 [Anthonomus grandis grandis]|uniref:vacuolar protein-sorting-associated protein 36 n=1 Tax=Anthonomus grandis grandis TaxID=2921223 RepID=UPI0021657570|nr:vacuolar protein-sorting-associated protein 36 [Anthonomus grandis grandis]